MSEEIKLTRNENDSFQSVSLQTFPIVEEDVEGFVLFSMLLIRRTMT